MAHEPGLHQLWQTQRKRAVLHYFERLIPKHASVKQKNMSTPVCYDIEQRSTWAESSFSSWSQHHEHLLLRNRRRYSRQLAIGQKKSHYFSSYQTRFFRYPVFLTQSHLNFYLNHLKNPKDLVKTPPKSLTAPGSGLTFLGNPTSSTVPPLRGPKLG